MEILNNLQDGHRSGQTASLPSAAIHPLVSKTTPLCLEEAPVSQLQSHVGSELQLLEKLKIHTLSDLLLYLPREWQDKTRITPIAELQPGQSAQVEGNVQQVTTPRGKRMMLVKVADASGTLQLMFFNFSHRQAWGLRDARIRCFGEVRQGQGKSVRMIHPRYTVLERDQRGPALPEHLTPLYPSSGGTAGQRLLEKMIAEVLELAQQPGALADPISALIPPQLDFPTLVEALDVLHRTPPDNKDVEQRREQARARLALDELIADMIGQVMVGEQVRKHAAPLMVADDTLQRRLLKSLPFALTQAQRRVIDEIAADLQGDSPMLRLLQGDVGSGKTLVAVCAALQAIHSGWQVALMAPTEVLVEQHLFNLRTWLGPMNLDVAALTSATGAAQRRSILGALKSGELPLIVGTHALFEDKVKFHHLGLVIVDEQHRFGVHQRLRLVERGKGTLYPHQLTMTATPIPRTLAMITYTSMAVSNLDEMPPGRKPILTSVFGPKDRQRIIERIGQRCAEGARVYWVCTLIEESDQLRMQAATKVAEELAQALPQVVVGLIHGRMSSAEKSKAIGDFKSGQTHLLVATTVIEVGVDVPEATLMLIENPERLGLAQLHQLRGRVGRADKQSHCILLHGEEVGDSARTRLQLLCDHQDGFRIAEEDLRLRGAGELLGVRQAGEPMYRIFDYQKYRSLVPEARQIAQQLVRQGDEEPIRRLQVRWLAQRMEYANV